VGDFGRNAYPNSSTLCPYINLCKIAKISFVLKMSCFEGYKFTFITPDIFSHPEAGVNLIFLDFVMI
jgi:hypothetical protein